jgi:hypothetical protein
MVKALELRDGVFLPTDRVRVFQQWHDLAKKRGVLRQGQSRDEYLAEFLRAYRRAKYPLQLSPVVVEAWRMAKTEPLPADADVFESSEARLLFAICRNLQLLSNGAEWFLSARTAGPLIGVSHTLAASWLRALVDLEILEIVKAGTTTQAPRYSFKNPLR